MHFKISLLSKRTSKMMTMTLMMMIGIKEKKKKRREGNVGRRVLGYSII